MLKTLKVSLFQCGKNLIGDYMAYRRYKSEGSKVDALNQAAQVLDILSKSAVDHDDRNAMRAAVELWMTLAGYYDGDVTDGISEIELAESNFNVMGFRRDIVE